MVLSCGLNKLKGFDQIDCFSHSTNSISDIALPGDDLSVLSSPKYDPRLTVKQLLWYVLLFRFVQKSHDTVMIQFKSLFQHHCKIHKYIVNPLFFP